MPPSAASMASRVLTSMLACTPRQLLVSGAGGCFSRLSKLSLRPQLALWTTPPERGLAHIRVLPRPFGSLGSSCTRGFAAGGPTTKKATSWGNAPPVTMKTVIAVMMLGAGGLAIVNSYKDRKIMEVMQTSQQTVGKASVGGPFALTDQDGNPFTDRDLQGEFTLIYFGFTHCPDICPDELEKLAEAIDKVEALSGVKIQPLFISVDPERDTPARVKAYIREFHPRMIGLTGSVEDVKAASKAYRVYFSKADEEASGEDYLVDHSIIHYLINPDGEFVTFYGKNYSADGLATSLLEHAASWQKEHPEYNQSRTIRVPPAGTALPALKRA